MAPPKRRSQRQIKRKRFASYTDEEEEDSDDTEEDEEEDDDDDGNKKNEDDGKENEEEEEKLNEQGRGTRRTQPKREQPKKKQQRPPPKKRKQRRVVRNRVSFGEQNEKTYAYRRGAEAHLANLISGKVFCHLFFRKKTCENLWNGKKAIEQCHFVKKGQMVVVFWLIDLAVFYTSWHLYFSLARTKS